MGRKKAVDEIQRYGVTQNIAYCLSNVWRWDKSFYACFIPKIGLSLLLPFVGIYFPRLLIDGLVRQVDYFELLYIIGMFCGILLFSELLALFTDAKINSMQDAFGIRYRNLCEKKYKTMDYEKTEDPTVNDLYKKAVSYAYAGENIVGTLSELCINLLGIVGFGGIIVMLDPRIPLLIIFCVIASLFVSKWVINYTNKNWRNWAPADRRIDYLWGITHSYDKIKDIKVYPYEGIVMDAMDKSLKERLVWHRKIWNVETIPLLMDILSAMLRNGAAYYILLMQLLDNQIDVGMFVFYFGAVTGFSEWINGAYGKFTSVLAISTRINFIRSFLELDNEHNRGTKNGSGGYQGSGYEIEFKNVSYKYPTAKEETIRNLTFKIEKGEKIALVGYNGAGKTTLVKLICGLYYPKDGHIFLNGINVRDISIDEYFSLFSVVFQDNYFMPITVSQFVSGNGLNINTKKVEQCLERAGLRDRVRSCPRDLETTFFKDLFDDDPGIELSGGERQKLLLARALYKDAPILILDEPTAALDPIAESETYQNFDDLTTGKTALYISHRLASTSFCDRIFFMEDGKIIECGSHQELMNQKGKYYEMFEIQSYYYRDEVTL